MQEISFYCDVDAFGKAGETRAFSVRPQPASWRRPDENVIKNSESILRAARNKIVLLARGSLS